MALNNGYCYSVGFSVTRAMPVYCICTFVCCDGRGSLKYTIYYGITIGLDSIQTFQKTIYFEQFYTLTLLIWPVPE